MKKFLVIVCAIFFLFSFTSCATLGLQPLNPDQKKVELVFIKGSARVAGAILMQKKPSIAAQARLICQGLVVAQTPEQAQPLMDQIYYYSDNDPVIAASVQGVFDLLEITVNVPVTAEQIPELKAAASGFIEGIDLATRH
jgi:hypothetical protein